MEVEYEAFLAEDVSDGLDEECKRSQVNDASSSTVSIDVASDPDLHAIFEATRADAERSAPALHAEPFFSFEAGSGYKTLTSDDIKDFLQELVCNLSKATVVAFTDFPSARPDLETSVTTGGVVTERKAPRCRIFLGYRVASDAELVEKLYYRLRTEGLDVRWDKRCLLCMRPEATSALCMRPEATSAACLAGCQPRPCP